MRWAAATGYTLRQESKEGISYGNSSWQEQRTALRISSLSNDEDSPRGCRWRTDLVRAHDFFARLAVFVARPHRRSAVRLRSFRSDRRTRAPLALHLGRRRIAGRDRRPRKQGGSSRSAAHHASRLSVGSESRAVLRDDRERSATLVGN